MLVNRFDAFLFDLDGVVYVGEEPLPEAVASLAQLREMGKSVRFLTNDPRPTRLDVVGRLRNMGIEASEKEVITSGWATARHLQRQNLGSAYVLGGRGLKREIAAAGVEVTDGDHPEVVVVGCDEQVCYRHVAQAARLISHGAKFVATNADGSFLAPGGPLPATGAIIDAIVAATKQQPMVVGKPYPSMFEMAVEGLGAETARTVMIGDDPSTDVLGAHQAGITSVLVSENLIHFPSPRDFRAADATIPDLKHLFDPRVSLRHWRKPSFSWPDRVAAGVTAVVFDGSGRVLLGKRADNGLWGLPSGRVEPGETVEEAVKREVKEETNVETMVQHLIGVYSDPASQAFAYPTGEVVQFVTSCFRCEVTGGILRPDRNETLEAAFFETEKLPADLLPMHPRWLSDALSGETNTFLR